jgi:hypothetical protein
MSETAAATRPTIGLSRRLRLLVKSCANVHRRGTRPDVFLFATPRSGSTWLMEIIASQPGFKYYDEPLNPRRENVQYGGLFPDFAALMPDAGQDGRIITYLKELQAGRHGYMNPAPFRRNHRYFTERIVFKIHEVEHLMDRAARECGARLIYLLRHPIANSISRTVQPRLEHFLRSAYHAALLGDSGQAAEIQRLAQAGTPLQRAVVSWCFENLETLRHPDPARLVVTYEELVLNPIKACDLLMRRLELDDRAAMLASFERPAINIRMSHAETLAAMASADAGEKRIRLVTKWRKRIEPAQVAATREVLVAFGIDAYDPAEPLANAALLHFADTPALLGHQSSLAS